MVKKLYACKNLEKELASLSTEGVVVEYLDFAYHRQPEKLPPVLQEKLGRDLHYEVILLGFGLCSKAIKGIRAVHQPVVVPRVHDCIALFLGSHAIYQERMAQEPDTYYLTRGWLAEGEEPVAEFAQWCNQYGEDTARWLKDEMYRHYRRVCLLDTGVPETHRIKAREVADFLGAAYSVYPGNLRLVKKLLQGPWDSEFIVLQPGETLTGEEFLMN